MHCFVSDNTFMLNYYFHASTTEISRNYEPIYTITKLYHNKIVFNLWHTAYMYYTATPWLQHVQKDSWSKPPGQKGQSNKNEKWKTKEGKFACLKIIFLRERKEK